MIKIKTQKLELGVYIYSKNYILNDSLKLSVKLQYRGNDLYLKGDKWGYYSIKNNLENVFIEIANENEIPKLSNYPGNNHGYVTLDVSFNDDNVNIIETKLKEYLKATFKGFKTIEFV